MSISSLKGAPVVLPQSPIEQMKGKTGKTAELEKIRLRKATQEFEAMFNFQLLKSMRKTIPKNNLTEGSSMGGGMGKDLFTEMFDMELSRAMSQGKHGSIASMLFDSMEKLIDAQYGKIEDTPEIKPFRKDETQGIPFDPTGEKFEPIDQKQPVPLSRPEPFAPLNIPPRSSEPTNGIEPIAPVQMRPPKLISPEVDRPIAADHTSVNVSRPKLPSSEAVDPIMARFGRIIEQVAEQTELDSTLIWSVVRAESAGDPNAVSPAGAKGLMQLVDATASDYGVKESFDPAENIRGGSQFLKDLIERFGDLKLALAAYNAGPGTVEKYGGMPPFKETREYVNRVMDSYASAKRAKLMSNAKVR